MREAKKSKSCSVAFKMYEILIKLGVLSILYKIDMEKAYDHIYWGISIVLVEEMWFQGEMEVVDEALCLHGSFLGLGEW